MIKPRSELTNSRKATGHESVNQPLKSLALRLRRQGAQISTEIFSSCISAVNLRTALSEEYPLQDQIRAQSPG